MPPITTGTAPIGLRWARCGEWRILAGADGSYAKLRQGPDPQHLPWVITSAMPEEIERALCAALRIDYAHGKPE